MLGIVVDEEQGLLVVPLAHVLAIANPLTEDPWGIGVLDASEVLQATYRSPWRHDCQLIDLHDRCRECEIDRIAHLVVHGWPPATEDPRPVMIDVGLFDYIPDWPIVDGNHRIAAACVRGDARIELVYAGDCERAISMLVHGTDL